MKNSNCGGCPHIHRCYATNDNECIDTIIGKKHYMSEHDRQIRADYLNEIIDILNDSFPMTPSADITCGYYCAIERLEQLKEQENDTRRGNRGFQS